MASSRTVVEATVKVVRAYVAANVIPPTEISAVIEKVHVTLRELNEKGHDAHKEPPKPAVPKGRSIHRDYLICLEDGKKYKSLKRHLRAQYNLSPDEYRRKWGLPADYPMVAPSYGEKRSALARHFGLGRRADEDVAAEKPSKAPPETALETPGEPPSQAPSEAAQGDDQLYAAQVAPGPKDEVVKSRRRKSQ